jgi:hypothetical protein
MKRLVVLAAAAVAAVAAIAVVTGTGGAQAPPGQTITVYEVNSASRFALIDNPPRSRRPGASASVSPGDLLTLRIPLVDASNQPAGTLHVLCGATAPGRTVNGATWQCSGTAALKGGELALSVAFKGQASPLAIAVTGGTAAYEGARGSITSVSGQPRNTDTIHLLP